MADRPKLDPPSPDRPPRSAGFLISQLGFLSSQRFARALKPLGIGPRDFLLLRYVAASEGLSQHALGERLGVPPSRMVALVDHLEEEGLVERRLDREDRRIRALHLTRKGRRVLERAGKIAVDYELELCSPLTKAEREQLIDLLQKLQAAQTELRGVHPGLATDRPRPAGEPA